MSTASKKANRALALAKEDQPKDVFFSTEHTLDLFALNLDMSKIQQAISGILQSYNFPENGQFLIDSKGRWLGFRPAEEISAPPVVVQE